MSTKLRNAIKNRKNPGATDIEQIRKELDRVSANANISYYDVILKDVFKSEFEKFKEEIVPVFEVWMTDTFNEMIQTKLRGEKGDRGLQGERGEKGEKGDRGLQGERGAEGAQGPEGKPGVQGKQGERGRDGDKGDKGDSVTLQEVLDKVGPELAQFKTEVKKALSSAKKGGSGGGGGGMGNTEDKAFSGDGSTVAFTLDSNVASGGKAAMVIINGQVQERATHYSISGKTVTFVTAPEDGTFIWVQYIRA